MDLAEVVVAHQDRAVLRLGDVFVKVESDPAKAQREHDLLSSVPVPVPQVVWWRPGSPSLLGLARATGESLLDSDDPRAWAAAGETTRRLHQWQPPDGWSVWLQPGVVRGWLDADRDWLLERFPEDRRVVDAAHAMAAEVLTDRTVERSVLTHRDLQAGHIFIDGDRVTAVIDWGDAAIGDPLYDVAVLTVRHQAHLDDVVVGYGEVDRNVVRGWWAERLLGEPRWLVEHGFDPADSLAGLRSLV